MTALIPFITRGTYFGSAKEGSYERQGTYGIGWLDAYLFSHKHLKLLKWKREYSSGGILFSH